MIDTSSREYERQYAYDMRVMSAYEICEQSGVELIHSGNGMWRWKRGVDHSYDDPSQNGGFFDTRDEAAIGFTQSESFQIWLRSRGVRA
jgi:hypothetical protein